MPIHMNLKMVLIDARTSIRKMEHKKTLDFSKVSQLG